MEFERQRTTESKQPAISSVVLAVALVFALLVPVSAVARIYPIYLDDLEIEELSAHAKLTSLLLYFFPQKKYHYVILGRSPALLATRLESFGVTFSQLPFSLRSLISSDVTDGIYYRAITSDTKQHFARYLPTKAKIFGKKLVIIDYILSGKTLAVALFFVNTFYGFDKSVEFFGVFSEESSSKDRINNFRNSKGVLISLEQLDVSGITSMGFFTGRYKAFSKYPSFRINMYTSDFYEEHESDEPDSIVGYKNYQHAVSDWAIQLHKSRL